MRKFDKSADARCATLRFRRGALKMNSRKLLADTGQLAVDWRLLDRHRRLQKSWPSEFSPTPSIDPRTFVGALRPHCRQCWFEQRRIWTNSFLQDGREGPPRDHHATFGLKVKIA